MQIREALTFDDVSIEPAASDVLPGQASLRTRLTAQIELGIPLLSAAMDTVTEHRLAIAIAQAGGIGVVHKNMDVANQAKEVTRVKKVEAGMVVNPLTISPERPLADALALKERHGISGIPVVESDNGLLVGILTNRDVRFASDASEKIRNLMTKDNLVTVREGVDREEAKRLLHRHRIEKLLVVDEQYRCVGMITVRDIERSEYFPDSTKDEKGRLRVAAATGVGDGGLDRAEALLDAGADVIVVDTAHGHSASVIGTVKSIKKLSNRVQVIAGNVATGDGTRALIDAGVAAVKVGIGPGSICTT